ncbi:NUDIX domain-containing protein [Ornithinimicrobium murale]|uniref:NUDIX domain-containing protein n=1 Tax=Ornithinimicrobium murale TaxID=1050153 RepID=UPI0013B36A07|nr:NUDIX domain-containing protein [Ornithinimicrobium murale]
MATVRAATRGLVVADGKLLVTVLHGTTGEYWLTPGGGQRFGETKRENAEREVLEETGYHVRAGDLACGRDYLGVRHYPEWDSGFQQTELFFWCTLLDDRPDRSAMEPDANQSGVLWVPLEDLVGSPLFPRRLAAWLHEPPEGRPVWLGDIN